MSMTHAELVERAERWLRNSAHAMHEGRDGKLLKQPKNCRVVLCEQARFEEQPDAIGWLNCGRESILIECKATRSDFHADRHKLFRSESHQRFGVGKFRYYMTPKGLLRPDELPSGWGLLECLARQVRVICYSGEHEYDERREMGMLWSECRKIQIVQAGGELIATQAGRRISDALGGICGSYGG